MAYGTLSKIVHIVLPFISRTALLYIIGEQYLGLSSLFSSILGFLSLTELGIGNAMVYSMYKPIAQNDTKTLKALLNLYKRLFRIIGAVFLTIGICLMPFLRGLIKGDVPADINIYVLYSIYLVNAVLSYWLFAYKVAILQAHQRGDIGSKIGMIITVLSYIFMLSSLFITKNYYAYIIWVPIFTIATNILRAIIVNRLFPGLEPEGDVDTELKKSITKKVAALIGTKLNTVVLHSADNLVMSAFLGLTTIAIYGNYYYIMSSICGFVSITYGSMTAGLGNSLVLETKEKNYNDFIKFSFINSWIVGWCATCLACLYQPFMTIWTKGRLLFPLPVVLCFVLYFYVYMIRKIPVVYKDAAGIWWEDRFRPYVCMVVNVVLNIWLVQVIGVSGIILSTVFSLFISIPWENYTIFKHVFNRSSKEYYLKMAQSLVTAAIGGLVCYGICSLLPNSIFYFLVRGAICIVIPNLIFVGLNCKRHEFGEAIAFAKRIIKRQY